MDNTSIQPSVLEPLIQQPLPPTPGVDQKYLKFAGFSTRLLALTIDFLISLPIVIVLTFVIQYLSGQPFSLGEDSPFELLFGIIFIIYNISLLTIHGATIGKKLVHIRVVNTNYDHIRLTQAIVRETIGKFISGIVFYLGYIWIAIDDNKQGWHDKIAKTYVIYERPITQEEFIVQQQNKRSNLPLVLIILGILESVLFIVIAVIMMQLIKLYESVNLTGYNPLISNILVGLILIFSLLQIIYGIFLIIKQNKSGVLDISQKKIAKTLLIIGILAIQIGIPIMMISIIAPIYKLTTYF